MISAPAGPTGHDGYSLIGQHASMIYLRALIARAAPLESAVVVEGPTGSGKELVVRELFRQSALKGELVCVNAAALPDGLVDSELFGVTRGAFTGAVKSRDGRIRQAHMGMLYLDEATELTPAVQAKLLRTLESGEVHRLGGSGLERVTFRLVISVQENPESLVQAGRWRSDFKYRVGTLRLNVPSLAERRSDIPLLTSHFLRQHPIDGDALSLLEDYEWPGNVRQLRHVLERALFLAGGRPMTHHVITEALAPERCQGMAPSTRRPSNDQLVELLRLSGGRVESLAKMLQVSRATAYRWLGQAGVLRSRMAPA